MGSHVSSTQAREQVGRVGARRRTVSRNEGGKGTVQVWSNWREALLVGSAVLERDLTQGRPSASNLQHSSCTADSYKIPQLALLGTVTPAFVRDGYDGMACSMQRV